MVVGLSIGGLVRVDVDGRRDGSLRAAPVDEEGVERETGVPFAALGVEDPEGRLAPRRSVAVVRDDRLGALADDVAAQADPRPASQLEPDAGRLGRPRSRGRRASPGASRIRSRVSARRASAASRWSRSATLAGLSVFASRPPGRSRTSMSTDLPASRLPAIESPSSRLAGVMTTSHSSRMPRATASTGSKLRDRSSQATTEPCAWASAATRRESVVRPLEPSPRIATLADFGRPPGPRIASSAAKPVWMTRSSSRPGS